ncbi:MAG: FAD-binding protein, partial [Pyrinomonadaceae bacterium]
MPEVPPSSTNPSQPAGRAPDRRLRLLLRVVALGLVLLAKFFTAEKTITVEAGTRWRQIQEHIDSANLAVKIMQSYANFTVGGSLSVNAHGRYVGLGPVILSVKSLQIVLADGAIVEASPTHNPDIFNGVIGGYGGLGLIVEATLELTTKEQFLRAYPRASEFIELKRRLDPTN